MEERQNSVVKEIMGKVVSAQSARNYSYQNIAFALFCYESDELRSHLLESWFVERMPQKPSEKKTYVKECLLACSPEDDNCPFILCNLTFAHFSNFLSTRTRRKGKNKGQENSLGNASYDQAKSALVHLFRMSKYDISKDLAEKLKMFMKGIKRHVATKSFENGDSGIIGKKKMDFKVYEKNCELFFKEEGEEFIFGRCFLTLEWNLMARSESVVYANFFHVTWEDDCLVFRFPKSKTDQTGRNRDQLWHVYATPNNPATCPVLALAMYIFANPGLTQRNFKDDSANSQDREDGDNTGRLFPGGDQYGRFMDCLRRIVKNNPEVFVKLGISPGNLGSHSARKGACSLASAGTTVSPPMVSICLQAMWSMGSVKERYLQYEKAGDQYLGRVVSGLDVNDVSFAVSPPYFKNDGNGDDVREKVFELLKDYMVGGHSNISGAVFQLLYHCFASLCYHYDFLVGILPKRNKLQASPFFTNLPNYAREAAAVRFPWNKTAATPTFTGLPPHVCILAQLEGLKEKMEHTGDRIISQVKDDLDGRRLGSQSYFDKEEIIAKMAEFHQEMIRRVEVVGRKSSASLQGGDVGRHNEDVMVGGVSNSASTITNSSALTIVEPSCGRKFQFFFSAGNLSRVHADFVFPKMTLCTLITSWFCGNESTKTVPFKMLKATEIKKKKERYKLSQMKTLMLAVEIAAERAGVWQCLSQRGSWNVGSTVRLYESVHCFFAYQSKMQRRNEQISWQTVYNLFKVNRKVFATDLE